MNKAGRILSTLIGSVLLSLALLPTGRAATHDSKAIPVTGPNFSLGPTVEIRDGDRRIRLQLAQPSPAFAFNQSALKQSTAAAKLGPSPERPHFAIRYALPIPPDNATNVAGTLTGLDPNVWAHNHSPGLEALPNGDLLAIYFSARTSAGTNESDPSTRFIQARLRHGAEQWDPPELFLDFEGMNDQSALLWTEGNTIRFFGGGRGAPNSLPFKLAVSTNNGATWTVSLPLLDKPASDYTAQPIANAFRGGDGAIYFAMDAADDGSFLWRSGDNGLHWTDTGGRTGARHSTIIPLDDRGRFLSLGGKNAGIQGWTPMNFSSDWGRTWSPSERSPFPALGGNQRPSLIRLANGHLLFVTDSYHRNAKKSPAGWTLGEGCFVAISKDNGTSWHFKQLPVALRHEKDHALGTLGYATARQTPNGIIHVLATMTHPCLHYEFNEAWVFSSEGDITPESRSGSVESFRENYPDGSKRITWSARVCPNGRYLLNGRETSYHPNGCKEHEVTYVNGHKTGEETFWSEDGTRLWRWQHYPRRQTSTWTHYWPNGKPKLTSRWNTRPQARESLPARTFVGLEAQGAAEHWDEQGKPTTIYHFDRGALLSAPEKGDARHGAD